MTSVYIAARFDLHAQLIKEVIQPLVAAGHHVTSNWVRQAANATVLDSEELKGQEHLGQGPAQICQRDIRRADAFAVFTHEPSTTGGYHVEFGMAIAMSKRLHVVGPVPNIFYTLPGVNRYPDTIAFLKKWGYDLA